MSDAAWDEWKSQMKGLNPVSPIDQKARDLTVAYFELETRNIASASAMLGVERKTVARRLRRAHVNGWALLGAAPLQAGKDTLPRVCRRRIFWTRDYRSAMPEWDGNTRDPVF